MSYKQFKNKDYEIEYLDIIYKVSAIHPILEQKRSEILNNIQNRFIKVVRKYIDDEFLKGRRKPEIILAVTLSRFIMTCLSKKNTVDPVIPNKIHSYRQLKKDLYNKLSRNKNLSDSERHGIIKKIIKEVNLEKLFSDGTSKLYQFFKSDEFSNEKNKFGVIKNKNKDYITLSFNGDNIDIYRKLYYKLFNGFVQIPPVPKNTLIWCLIKRYIILKSFGQQFAVHPKNMDQLKTCYNIRFELFGSALNVYNKKYCSMFYDLEKYFGSYGSFFDIKLIKGNFTMNPPFDETLIKDSVLALIKFMQQTNKPLSVIIWIPVWDSEGLKQLVIKCPSDKYKQISNRVYGEYEGMTAIEKSKFMVYKEIVCEKEITYFDYLFYRKTKATDTYKIVLSNQKWSSDKLKCLDQLDMDI